MKVIALVEGSTDTFKKMINLSTGYNAMFIDTENCDEEKEYRYLISNIHSFRNSGKEIMIAKFSGRDSVVGSIGGECPEMIVPFICNKNSKYYIANPVETFLDLLNLFEKETD